MVSTARVAAAIGSGDGPIEMLGVDGKLAADAVSTMTFMRNPLKNVGAARWIPPDPTVPERIRNNPVAFTATLDTPKK